MNKDILQSIKPYRVHIWTIVGLLAFELLSFVAYQHGFLQNYIAAVVALVFVVISYKHPMWGMVGIFLELFLGVQGYSLAFAVGATVVPLRIVLFILWLSLVSVFSVTRYKDELMSAWRQYKTQLFGIVFVIILGSTLGLIGGNKLDLIFFDANAWLYWLYLVPFAMFTIPWRIIWPVVATAGVWLGAKTVVLEYIFSHTFFDTQWTLYYWLRDTRIAEITPIASVFQRVFSQSHIMLLIVGTLLLFYVVYAGVQNNRATWFRITGFAVVMSGIVISFSRSIWLGLLAGMVIGCGLLVWFVRKRQQSIPYMRLFGMFVLGIVLGTALFWGSAQFPIPPTDAGDFSELVSSRFDSDEPAANARVLLLKPLVQAATNTWFLGSGFGTTVTYTTTDPRIVAQTPGGSGVYTTYAFEWGYLDIWLKVGLIGILIYGMVVYQLWRRITVLAVTNNAWPLYAISVSIIMLAIVHVTTPFLNHPLGIGFILLGLVMSQSYVSANRA